jgi:hypothetical protein
MECLFDFLTFSNKITTRSTNYGYNSSFIYNAAHFFNSLIKYHTAVIKLEIGTALLHPMLRKIGLFVLQTAENKYWYIFKD